MKKGAWAFLPVVRRPGVNQPVYSSSIATVERTFFGQLKKSLLKYVACWRTGFLTRFKDTAWLPSPGITGKNAHAPFFNTRRRRIDIPVCQD